MPGVPYNLQNPNEKYEEEFSENKCNIDKPYRCPLNPTCAAMWNERTQAFVCQCHGCRFDLKGNVIKGPALDNIAC